jgi:large subunit ribosomal protein L7e
MGEEVKSIVPESVLKKQNREEQWALAKTQEFEAAKKKRAENRKLIYGRAKKYSQKYEDKVLVMSLQCSCLVFLVVRIYSDSSGY